MTEEPHLTTEEVAAYVDDALSEAESVRIKAHLATCEDCRSEVLSVSRLLETAPRARRRFGYWPALAAAAVVAVLIGRAVTDGDTPSDRVRGDTAPPAHEGVAAFQALSPIGRHPVGDRIDFVWRPPLAGATYRFTLTDERGGTIWTGSTNDTTITLPDAAVLRDNQNYHWFVDALLPDGTDATTGVRSFQVVR
jgi:hypothetical protein